MLLDDLRNHHRKESRGHATFNVMLGSDHLVHLVVSFDGPKKDEFTIPLSPDNCTQLAAMLIQGSQSVNGFAGNSGMIRMKDK